MMAALQSPETHISGTMKNPKEDWKSGKDEQHPVRHPSLAQDYVQGGLTLNSSISDHFAFWVFSKRR